MLAVEQTVRRVQTYPGGATLLKLALLAFIAALGIGTALGFDIHHLESQAWLYGIGLSFVVTGVYLGMSQIDLRDMRTHWLFLVLALGGGVVLKYAIIAASTFGLSGDQRFLVLAMLMVAIDPLAVSVATKSRQMGDGAKTILNVWAAGDDPLTYLLATPTLLIALWATDQQLERMPRGGDWLTMLPFALVMAGFGLWMAFRHKLTVRMQEALATPEESSSRMLWLVTASLGVSQSLTSLAAAAGLFLRFKFIDRYVGHLSNTILAAATFLLGLLLADGFDWRLGLLLGVFVFFSQFVAAWVVMLLVKIIKRKDVTYGHLPVRDVWLIALGQQNGITAIVLLLSMEPFVDGAVAIGASAIVFTNLIYFLANALFDRIDAQRSRK